MGGHQRGRQTGAGVGGQAGRKKSWVDKWTAKDRYSGGWWVDGHSRRERQWLKMIGQENRSNVNEKEAQSQCEVIITEIISDVKLI